MIAELALLFGFTDQQPEIGRRIIARAAENLDFYDSSQSMEPEARQERPQVDSSRSVAGLPWVRKRLVQRSFWHPVIAVAAGMVVGMLAFIVSSHVDHSFMQGFTTELSPLRGPVQSLPEHPLPPTSEPTMPNMTGHTVAGSGPRSKQAADQATSNQQDQAVASTNLLVSEQTIQKAVPLPTGLPLGATEQDARASLDVVARAENELSAPPAPHPAKHKQGKWPVPPDKTKVLQEEKDQVQEKVPGLADSNVSPNDIRDITLHAKALSTQGRDAEAASLYQRALALQEQTLGPEHPSVVSSLNNLAGLYYVRGSYAEAALLYRRILAIDEKLFGPEHPNMATSLNNLAVLYETQGRYGEAEPLYQRALAIKERALGPDHLSLATSLSNLAVLYHVQGRYAEAEPLYQRALAMDEKRLGPEHPDIATVLENYAALLRKTHREAEAEGLEARVQEIRTIHTR